MRKLHRLLTLLALFLVTTGQASTDGCAPPLEDATQETTPGAPAAPAGDTAQDTLQLSATTTSASGGQAESRQAAATRDDADGTVPADRPILDCPVRQQRVKNGTPPDLEVLKRVFRCNWGEKPADRGMDGAVTIDVEAMEVGTPRRLDLLLDSGDGIPGETVVYPVRVTWTEKTFYRTRTAVNSRKSAIQNFHVNSLGEWQTGSATNVDLGSYSSVPRAQ